MSTLIRRRRGRQPLVRAAAGALFAAVTASLLVVAPSTHAADDLTEPTVIAEVTDNAVYFSAASNAGGDTAVVWETGAGALLYSVSRARSSDWSPPTELTAEGAYPQVAMNDAGVVVFQWLEGASIMARRLSATGVLGAARTLQTTGAQLPSVGGVVIDAQGRATAAWSTSMFTPPFTTTTWTTTSGAAGIWETPTSHAGFGQPHLSIGPSGRVALAVVDPGNDPSIATDNRPGAMFMLATSDSFGLPTLIGGAGRTSEVRVHEADNGTTRGVYVQEVAGINSAFHTVQSGVLWSATRVSAKEVSLVDATLTADGELHATWFEQRTLDEQYVVKYLRHASPQNQTLETVQESLIGSNASYNHARIALDDGIPHLVWTGDLDGTKRWARRTGPEGPAAWTTTPMDPTAFLPVWGAAGSDLRLVWSRDTTPGSAGGRQLVSSVLDTTAPRTTLTAPTHHSRATAAAVRLTWDVVDASPTATALSVRTAPHHAGFGAATVVRAGLTGTTTTVPLRPGRTHCFTARSTDDLDHVGAPSNERCVTTPVDDRTFSASTGWRSKKATGHYLSTYRQAKRRGATLTLPRFQGRTLTLLAATGPGNGKVAIFVGRTKVKTVNLARSSSRTRVSIPVTRLAGVRTAKLRIKVLSNGKPVRIDGFFVQR